jgi:heptosyltransferase-2
MRRHARFIASPGGATLPGAAGVNVKRRFEDSEETIRILIVKIGAIGDVVMALQAVTAARGLAKNVHLSWLAGSGVAPLLRIVEGIDRVVEVDERWLLAGGAANRMRALASVWRTLGGRRFDLVVSAHSDWRYRFLDAPVRGVSRRWSRKDSRTGAIPGRFHGDEYVRLLLGTDGPSSERHALPNVAVPSFAGLGDPSHGTRRVVIAPGGARNVLRDDGLRRWPLGHYLDVADQLAGRGLEVVIVGGSGDTRFSRAFRGHQVTDMVGKTDLIGLCGVIKSADVLVTHDSGPLHLARLVGTPSVALFGPTDPREKATTEDGTVVLWQGTKFPCAPCYDGRGYAQCSRNRCLESISSEEVVRHVHLLLSASVKAGAARTGCVRYE